MISFIIPTFNEEEYIEEILKELSTLKVPHEIIVTDDKSTDATCTIASKYTSHVLVPSTKHATIAANRNSGAQQAHGDMLVFMDADSRIDNPHYFFETVLEYFKNDPALVGLTCFLRVEKDTENFFDIIVYFIFNIVHVFKNNIFHTGESSGKFQMIPREAFLKVNGFREDLVTREDADLFQRLNKIGKTYCTNSLIVFHSGRRAHAIGWPKLLFQWGMNSFWFFIRGESWSHNWNKVSK